MLSSSAAEKAAATKTAAEANRASEADRPAEEAAKVAAPEAARIAAEEAARIAAEEAAARVAAYSKKRSVMPFRDALSKAEDKLAAHAMKLSAISKAKQLADLQKLTANLQKQMDAFTSNNLLSTCIKASSDPFSTPIGNISSLGPATASSASYARSASV